MLTYMDYCYVGQETDYILMPVHRFYKPVIDDHTGLLNGKLCDMAFYELVLNGSQLGNAMLTVLHYEIPNPGSFDWQDVADWIKAEMAEELQALMVPNAQYDGITVREDTPGAIGNPYSFTGGALVGTATTPRMIAQSAVLVRKVTSSGFRPAFGRVFQSGISVGLSGGDGLWPTTVVNGLESFWNTMRTLSDGVTDVGTLVVKASKPTNPNTVAYNPVTFMDARVTPTDRSTRKLGRGS